VSEQLLAVLLADDMSLSYHSQTQKNEIATELRRLYAEKEQLKTERDALLEALREYAHHKAGCSVGYMGDYNGDCDCGLIAAIDAARGDK